MARTRSSVRSNREPTPPPSAQVRGKRPRLPPRDATAERREVRREEPLAEPRVDRVEDHRDTVLQRLEEEQRQARKEQWQARQYFSALMDTVRSMAVALARLQKRPVEEMPQSASEQDRVPPPPPPPFVEPPAVQYAGSIPAEPPAGQFVMPPAVGQYTVPPPGMPGVPIVQMQGIPERVHVPGQR